MKKLLITIFGVLLLGSCYTSNTMYGIKDNNLIDIKQDKEEYELLVLDPGFETWFVTTWSPASDRPLDYYRMWNHRYVNAWNYKATHPHSYELFDNTIQYDPTANYGMEVERKLYYYFRWVDTELKIPILDSLRPAGIL